MCKFCEEQETVNGVMNCAPFAQFDYDGHWAEIRIIKYDNDEWNLYLYGEDKNGECIFDNLRPIDRCYDCGAKLNNKNKKNYR